MSTRGDKIAEMKAEGATLKEIADKTGISRQRVHTLLKTDEVAQRSDMDFSRSTQKKMRQHQFLESLALNAFDVKQACVAAEVPRSTYRQWMKTDPEFIDQIGGLREEACQSLEAMAFQIAKGEFPGMDKPSPDMIKFMLKNLHRDYQDTKKLEVTGKVEHKHEHDFQGWSKEQLEHYVETGEEMVPNAEGVYEPVES